MSNFQSRQEALAAKIRELTEQYPSGTVTIVSLATTNGGCAGVVSQVPVAVAALEVISQRAEIAEPEVTPEATK